MQSAVRLPARVSGSSLICQYRSQRDCGLGWQNPLLGSGDQSCARPRVARRLTRPKCFPPATRRRRKQRFRSRIQDLSVSKVYYQQTIVVVLRKISENETCRSKDRAIDAAGTLLSKARIFPPQFQKIDVQIIKFAILFALGQIQFAATEYRWVIRCGETSPCLFFGKR